jgi:hypothetical protein
MKWVELTLAIIGAIVVLRFVFSFTVLFIAALLALMLSGCAQVHQSTIAVKCVDRPATQLLPGEAPLNSMTVIDASTRAIPLISTPHREVAICGDEEGAASWGMETPVEGGLNEFSDPIKAAFDKFNYGL